MILGVQFSNPDGTDLSIDKLFTWTDPVAGLSYNGATDCINIYDPKTGWKYYYWKKNKNKWYEKGVTAEPASYPTLKPGESCYFVRAAGTSVATTTLTLSGGVMALGEAQTFDVDAGNTKIISNPWPVPFDISTIEWTDPVAGLSYNGATDCINIYNPRTGWKYYYWKKNKNKWYEKGVTAEPTSYPSLNPGEAFFFVRAAGASVPTTTITFKGPEYKDPQ